MVGSGILAETEMQPLHHGVAKEEDDMVGRVGSSCRRRSSQRVGRQLRRREPLRLPQLMSVKREGRIPKRIGKRQPPNGHEE